MILLIDNYDSFTYNLVQRIGELLVARGEDPAKLPIQVMRNDKITIGEAEAMHPERIIISPGPCTPKEAGVSVEMVQAFAGKVPMLGVCLGHQSIGAAFGMTVDRNYRLMHGKTSPIQHDRKTIFTGIDSPAICTRYHSLAIVPDTFDHDRFEISAKTEEGEIMALRTKPGALGKDRPAPLEGVQFHPESFLTEQGPRMLANFLDLD